MTPHDNSNATSGVPPGGASISGTIEFQDVRESALNVTLYVRVEETSYADAKASTVAEQVLRGVNIVPGSLPIRFSVHGIPANPHARYVVRVHADVDGDGVISRGDYVSMQSYPVDTTGKGEVVTIMARQVR